MDPYLPTWLAEWGAACLLVPTWAALAALDLRAGRWLRASVLGGLAAVTGIALWTHLGPLLVRAPLPTEPTALAVAAGAPFVAFTLLALARRQAPVAGFDLAAVLPAALFPHGLPAWGLATVLLGRGHVLPGAARRPLMAGLLLLAPATVADARHADLESRLPLGHDDAVRVVAMASSGMEGAGWLALTRWARRDEA
ncbi:MAG: hypothetical protein H6735_23385 [Alphaproteobacteria bacterium]|nr:hypothetical protein [Alphaproteobacteria bacterium]